MMCQICGKGVVTDGLTVDDGPKRLIVSAAGLVVEVAKDPRLAQPERDNAAWEAAGMAMVRTLRDHHRRGDL